MTETATPTSHGAADKPANPYARQYTNFLDYTQDHQLSVLKDDGLYRHLRMHNPEFGSMWSWQVVTWPWHLTTVGDIADGYTFSRDDDMLGFFGVDGLRRDYYADGAPLIDFRYWAEKLNGIHARTARHYSSEVFLRLVGEHLDEDDELGLEAQIEYDKLVEVTRRIVARSGHDWDLYLSLMRLEKPLPDLEIDESDPDECEYFGLPIPAVSPAERRQEILDEAQDCAHSEHEARQWLDSHDVWEILGDSWEWDLNEWDTHFLYTCWAIDLTVQAYRRHQKDQIIARAEALAHRDPTKGDWDA